MKQNEQQARFLDKKIAPQAKRMKQNESSFFNSLMKSINGLS